MKLLDITRSSAAVLLAFTTSIGGYAIVGTVLIGSAATVSITGSAEYISKAVGFRGPDISIARPAA